MEWKEWPGWVKGGVWGLGIGILLIVLGIVVDGPETITSSLSVKTLFFSIFLFAVLFGFESALARRQVAYW